MSAPQQAPNDLEFIGSAVRRMVSNVQNGIAIEQLMESSAGPSDHSRFPQISSLYDGTSIPWTLNLFHQIFAKEITLCVTRILDGRGDDRASFGEIFRRLAKAETRQALIRLREQAVRLFYNRDVFEWLNEIEASWTNLRQGDERTEVDRLFEARNAYIAHALLLDANPGTYSAMFRVFRRTADLVSEFGQLTGHYQNGFDVVLNQKRNLAFDFWDTLIAGEPSMRDRLRKPEK